MNKKLETVLGEMIAQAEEVELIGEFTDEATIRKWVREIRAAAGTYQKPKERPVTHTKAPRIEDNLK